MKFLAKLISGAALGFIALGIAQAAGLDVRTFGAKCDGTTNDLAAIHRTRDALANGGEIILPSGTCSIGAGATGIVLSGTETKVYRLIGSGAATTIKYTGAGDALKLDNAAGTSVMQGVRGVGFDLTGAGAAANAIHISGSWRFLIEDVFLRRDAGGTGAGILADNATAGTFDLRLRDFYIRNFGRGIKLVGGGTNKITNMQMLAGYVSSCTVNVDIANALDVSAIGVQSESSTSDGIKLDTVDNFSWIGGAIEGSGGWGVNATAAVNGINVIAGMFNNLSGDFTGAYSQLRYTGSQVLDIYDNALVRMRGIAAGNKAYLQFFENGTADARLARGGSGNSIGLYDGLAANAERLRFDATNAIVDLLTATGRFRAQNGAYFEFLISGTSTKIRAGTGSPAGVVVGNIGDLFLRTDGGAATSIYVKESGAGTSAGWVGK